jgi:hypothetical protein
VKDAKYIDYQLRYQQTDKYHKTKERWLATHPAAVERYNASRREKYWERLL